MHNQNIQFGLACTIMYSCRIVSSIVKDFAYKLAYTITVSNYNYYKLKFVYSYSVVIGILMRIFYNIL